MMQPIRRYTLTLWITEPRDPDDVSATTKEQRDLERKIIRLLKPLDGDVDAEVMSVEDLTEAVAEALPGGDGTGARR